MEMASNVLADTWHRQDLPERIVRRFFFHVVHGHWHFDSIGERLPNRTSAVAKAHQIARELLEDTQTDWRMTRIEVTDDRGCPVETVRLADVGLR